PHSPQPIAADENGEELIVATSNAAVKPVPATPPVRKSREHLCGSGIGKIWMADDAFSPETDLLIQQMFEQPNPNDDPG
ncbi:MAG: hypothetical protein V4555_02510, partial [Acidobacteriota bacterium]